MPYFFHDGIRFYYEDVGHGIPCIFQHGLSGSTEQSLEIFPRINGLRLIALDCRSHGRTEPPASSDQLSFSFMSGDLLSLLEHLEITQMYLGGISMGAGVALNLALRQCPRILGMMLVRPAWLGAAMQAAGWFQIVAKLIREKSIVEGKKAFAASAEYAALRIECVDVANSLLRQFDAPQAAERAARLEKIPLAAPYFDDRALRCVDTPALVIGTAEDPVHPLSVAQTLAATLPQGEFQQVISKSSDPVRHLDEVQAAIRLWLSKIEERRV